MEINLGWVALANYVLLLLIGMIILFIFLRRLALYPFLAWFERRKTYYLHSVEKILARSLENDEYVKKITRVKNLMDKSALEEVLIEALAAVADKNKRRILIRIYEETGIAGWRIGQMKSFNVWKRRMAADLLGKSQSLRAETPLFLALRDKDEDVRLIAAKGLGKLKAKGAIDSVVDLFKDFPPEKCLIVANILIDFGEEAVPALSETLKTPNLKTCYWSLRALSEIDLVPDGSKYRDLEEKLEKLLPEHGARIRAYSAICLAKIASWDMVGKIASLLEDHSPVVRAEACRALGILGNPEAIDRLMKCLNDNNWIVNYAASRALITFGGRIKRKLQENLKSSQDMIYKRSRELLEELEIHARV